MRISRVDAESKGGPVQLQPLSVRFMYPMINAKLQLRSAATTITALRGTFDPRQTRATKRRHP